MSRSTLLIAAAIVLALASESQAQRGRGPGGGSRGAVAARRGGAFGVPRGGRAINRGVGSRGRFVVNLPVIPLTSLGSSLGVRSGGIFPGVAPYSLPPLRSPVGLNAMAGGPPAGFSLPAPYPGGVGIGPRGVLIPSGLPGPGRPAYAGGRAGGAVSPYPALVVPIGGVGAATVPGTGYATLPTRGAVGVGGGSAVAAASALPTALPPAASVPASWATLHPYCGLPATPVYYNFGTTVIYKDNRVYLGGTEVASATAYSQQATRIAYAGLLAAPPVTEAWQSLGVYALVHEGAETSSNLFQMAINKAGTLRGSYYDAISNTTLPVTGSVDKKSQRAAWTLGGKSTPVFEAGIANLTQGEAPLLAHYDPGSPRQFTLVRLGQDEGKK